jgi:hypothetical protein
MGKIEPNLELKRFGLEDGWITVTPDGISITAWPRNNRPALPFGHDDTEDPSYTFMLDPESAPLFRMVANRLDEMAGKRKRRS